MTRTPRAIAVVSGGLDSVVALAMAQQEYEVRLLLFFDYGQRGCDPERGAAIAVAGYYGLPFREVSLSWLETLSPEGMRASSGRNASDPGELISLDSVWIPNRNGVFLNTAAAFAESYDCDFVVTGFNREEAEEFPDNSAEYVRCANDALRFSTRNTVRVVAPTIELDKPAILREGLRLRAPLSVIWSCYGNGARMCGRCGACRRLVAALESLPAGDRPIIEFEGAGRA